MKDVSKTIDNINNLSDEMIKKLAELHDKYYALSCNKKG